MGPGVKRVTVRTGFGGGLFFGYDAWVSDEWALGALARFTAGKVTDEEETLHPLAFTVSFSALYH